MMYTATVTQKGQVTIPKDLRDKLKVKPREKVRFVEEVDGSVRIQRLLSIDELAGSMKVPKHLQGMSDRDWDKKIAETVAKEYAEKLKRC